jgi:glycosyltransferase involved in cell wall biosynthesis
MPHVEFLVSDLEYNAAARQVSLIAAGIVEPGWTTEVFTLAGGGPFTAALRGEGVGVLHSKARSPFNWLGLRWMVPAPGRGLVHVFGLPALRRLWAGTLSSRRPPVVLTLTGRERPARFDRHCLGIVSRVLVHHQHAADMLVGQGIPSKRICVIPSAVADASIPPARDGLVHSLGLPSDTCLLVTAGSLPDRHRLFQAVWAFEFIRYPHEDAHLLVIGDGPGRADLESNTRGLAPEGSRIHFLGERSDAPQLLAAADLVLVLHKYGGVNVALDAMAAGKAVVAANTPELAAIIRDGETGRFVPGGNAAAAASVIRKLILDRAERRRLGENACAFVRQYHSVETVVQMLEAIYEDEFTSTRSGLWTQ